MKLLVSAGEASGDLYAAQLVEALAHRFPVSELYGCAGPRLKAAGVRPVIDAASLAVVGLAEVVAHLPRIYGEYRKLVREVAHRRPDAAILTDSPDFHLRLARHLKKAQVPVFYLVAPQVWAWRQSRVKMLAKRIDHLFCIFPFEEQWFRERGVKATYIGHPLAHIVKPKLSKAEFFARYGLNPDVKTIVLLPGSRAGEAVRHLPDLLEAVAKLRQKFALQVLLATPKGFATGKALEKFRERFSALSIQVMEDETWNSLAYSDLALAASGTITVEAAILGTPMVTFYKVTPLTWRAGRRLVRVPYLCMVNLIAGRLIVPELMQEQMSGDSLASAAAELLAQPERAEAMRRDLLEVRKSLSGEGDPLVKAADIIAAELEKRSVQGMKEESVHVA